MLQERKASRERKREEVRGRKHIISYREHTEGRLHCSITHESNGSVLPQGEKTPFVFVYGRKFCSWKSVLCVYDCGSVACLQNVCV